VVVRIRGELPILNVILLQYQAYSMFEDYFVSYQKHFDKRNIPAGKAPLYPDLPWVVVH